MTTSSRLDDARLGRHHDLLLATARRLFEDAPTQGPSGWSASIVVSGSACDAAAGYALHCFLELDAHASPPRLSAGRSRRIRELLRSKKSVNLRSKTQREYWQMLTDDRLSRWPDWIRYVRCVERRNAVLHGGILPSRRLPGRPDALEAIEVAESFVAHLADVMVRDPRTRPLA